MKKIIAILMTVAIVGVFAAGCSGSGDNATPTDNAAPVENKPT